MFIKEAVFKNLINGAYKSEGLTVGNDGVSNELIVSMSRCVIRMKEDKIPNKIKEMLIELIGDLPAAGEFLLYKKKEDPQTELPFNEYWDIENIISQCTEKLNITEILLLQSGVLARILQNAETNKVSIINQAFINLVDERLIDDSVELAPEGPITPSSNPKFVVWHNKICKVLVMLRWADSNNKLQMESLKALESTMLDYDKAELEGENE